MKEITKLITDNQRLIYSIASKFSKYKDKEDLFQVGCIGMIEAYKNYNEKEKTKFTTYAYPYIFGQIYKYVNEDSFVKLNRNLITIKRKIEKAIEYLSQKLMRKPTSKEISMYLGIDEETTCQILNYKDPYSLDEIYQDELSMYDVLPGKEVDYNTLIALKNEIERLEEPERTIMINRYYEDQTQTEVADTLGITQVDVSRREAKVLKKLKRIFNWHKISLIL